MKQKEFSPKRKTGGKMKLQIILIMLLTSAFAQAGENGTMIKSDRLRAAPFSDAATLAALRQSRVEIKTAGFKSKQSKAAAGCAC
jgi:hypothetical protein